MENNFQTRLDTLKNSQLDLLRDPPDADTLALRLREIKLAAHQVLCDMAGAEIRDTGRISSVTREHIRKNRLRLTLAGVEPIAVEMEAAVIRQNGPEDV